MDADNSYKTIIRFDQPAVQEDGPIRRIVGFVNVKYMLNLFDDATLDANPRSAKVGSVTADIIDSVTEDPELFQFKTKGILLGTSNYDELERNRYELHFREPAYEGLLDGGHNMLALGTYLLSKVMDSKEISKIKLWDDFKQAWSARRDEVKAIHKTLRFKVPVELLVPSDLHDHEVVKTFEMALMGICAARNNNAQLTTEAKANQRGFYEEIRNRMPHGLAKLVEWKTNQWEGSSRPVKVRDLIALAWIPLSVLNEAGHLPTQSEAGSKLSFDVPPQKLYAGKGDLSKLFDRLMEHPDVSKPVNGPVHEMHNPEIGSAFDILARLPELYDKVFLELPDAYNRANNAKFGSHKAVKYNGGRKNFAAPFYGEQSAYKVPDGFVMPVVYGLKSLIKLKDRQLGWIGDPEAFLKRHIVALSKDLRLCMEMADFDPQKVGKSEGSYTLMANRVEMLLVTEKAAA